MKFGLLLLFLMVITGEISAQDAGERPYLNISYFGILGAHPGIRVGVQYPLVTFNKETAGKSLNQLAGALSAVLYFHRRNHIGAGLIAEFGFRNKRLEGVNTELFAGLGYLRSIRPNAVYDFDQANEMNKRKFTGNDHFIKTAAIGFGKSTERDFLSDTWTVRPTLLHLKPYGVRSTFNFALDGGIQIGL